MLRKIIGVTSCVALSALLLLPVASASGSPSMSRTAAGPADVSIVLAAGTVTSAGVPQAGASVLVEQWPEGDTGDSDVITTVLGTVQTDTAGRWQLRVPLSSFPQSADKSPDLHVTTVVGDRYAVTNKSAVDPSSSEGASKQASGAPLADMGSLDLSGPSGFKASSSAAAALMVSAGARQGSVQPGLSWPCGQVFVRNLPWTNIYFTRVWTDSQTRGRIVQSTSSSHEMGIQIGSEDKIGGFHASGTRSVTSTAGYNTNFTLYNQGVGNTWSYKLYRVGCTGGAFHYEARPYRAEGGPTLTPSTPPTWCVTYTNYRAGMEFFREANKGASLNITGNVMGSHVYAQSGWAATQTLTFHFYYPGRVCSGSSSGIFNALYVRADR